NTQRKQILEKTAKAENPDVAERAARFCLLFPLEPDLLKVACNLADFAAKAGYPNSGLGWRQLTKSLADYRPGRLKECIEWADKVLATATRQDLPGWNHERERNRIAAASLIKVNAYSSFGQPDNFKAASDSALLLIRNELPQPDNIDIGREWQDW